MKYTLAQYLSAVTLTAFTKEDFSAYCGVSTDTPLIGYGDYGPNGPTPYVAGTNDNPLDDTGFVLIVDGDDIEVIDNAQGVGGATVTADATSSGTYTVTFYGFKTTDPKEVPTETPKIPLADDTDNAYELAKLYAEQALGYTLPNSFKTEFPSFAVYKGDTQIGGG